MNGGPSQVDLFDPKPTLEKHNGETYETAGGQADVDHTGRLLRSPFTLQAVWQVRRLGFGIDAASGGARG